jgi:hypothetical protein
MSFDTILGIVSLTIGVLSAIFAVYVNNQTTKVLDEIKRESRNNQDTFQNYLSRFLESNPQVVTANAKRDFLKFLMSDPEMLRKLTIRPGGIIILSAIFDAKYSESEFNNMITNLYNIETEADVKNSMPNNAQPIVLGDAPQAVRA